MIHLVKSPWQRSDLKQKHNRPLKSVDKTLMWDIQMKAFEQYFHVVLLIMLYKVVLTFKSVDETLVCDH